MIMKQKEFDIRNFLFFLNEVHKPSIEDALIGAFVKPSSWGFVAEAVNSARQKDDFVQSINDVQLYVHVPFCGKLCTFCHCSRDLLRQRSDIDRYIKALKRQMIFFSSVYKGMDADSICLGGGTPSILNEQQLKAILDVADKAFPYNRRKIFFEVSPSSWTASKLTLLSNRGLSRLSVGIQSLDEKILKHVSRDQTRRKALWCLSSARKAGIPYVNADFIAGLPGQTVKGLVEDIKVVINEGANIIHVHPLTGISLKDMCDQGETIVEYLKRRHAMVKAAQEILIESGFHRRGLGAYMKIQDGEDYLEKPYSRLEAAVAGFGPYAIGQFPGAVFYKVTPKKSIADDPTVVACSQDFGYVMARYVMYSIFNGVDEQLFLKRFGVLLSSQFGEELRYLQGVGLIELSKGMWKFSGKWEIKRVVELATLSRVFFGSELLSRLRSHFFKRYNPQRDYSANSLSYKAFANNWWMTLYYQMGV